MIAALSFVVLLIGVLVTAVGHMKPSNTPKARAHHRKLLAMGLTISLLAVIGIGWGLQNGSAKDTTKGIHDYDSCAKAGNQIQESYPPVCRTKDGRTFTQPITKLQKCPDKWYENKMPAGTDTITQQYFIFGSERAEVDEVDVDWVVKNCKTKTPEPVY